MRTFAQKPQAGAKATSAKPATFHPAQAKSGPAFSGFDFSRISVHPPAPGRLQAKLKLAAPGDLYEQEADRVADQVVRMPQAPRPSAGGYLEGRNAQDAHARVQTKRAPANDASGPAVPPIVDEVLRSPGQPLDPATRSFMEPRFGHDFRQVRVHADAKAAESASSIGARAFTSDRNIVFGAGEYAPQAQSGRRLLSHELAHVVQQRGATVQRQVADEQSARSEAPKTSTGTYKWDSSSPTQSPATLAAVPTYAGAVPTYQVAGQKATADKAAVGAVPQDVFDYIKLREEWREDVYLSGNLLTAGMGHTLTAAELRQYKEGDKVPSATIEAWAQADTKAAYGAAVAQGSKLGISDRNFIKALTAVNFQLGTAWNSTYKKTWADMVAHEWDKAALEAQDSLWYRQTPLRVQDFQAALRALSGTAATPAAAAQTAPAALGTAYEFKIGAPIGRGSVTADSLNVRKGPDTNYDTTGTALQKGASVTIYGRVDGWICIGSSQWVSGKFISEGKKETGGSKEPTSEKSWWDNLKSTAENTWDDMFNVKSPSAGTGPAPAAGKGAKKLSKMTKDDALGMIETLQAAKDYKHSKTKREWKKGVDEPYNFGGWCGAAVSMFIEKITGLKIVVPSGKDWIGAMDERIKNHEIAYKKGKIGDYPNLSVLVWTYGTDGHVCMVIGDNWISDAWSPPQHQVRDHPDPDAVYVPADQN